MIIRAEICGTIHQPEMFLWKKIPIMIPNVKNKKLNSKDGYANFLWKS